MQLKINSKDLKQAYSVLSKVVPSNPLTPITSCIKFDSNGTSITLTASNLSTTMVMHIPCEGDKGTVCIEASFIKDVIDVAGDYIFTITGNNMKVKTKLGTSSCGVFDSIDFPVLPKVEGTPDAINMAQLNMAASFCMEDITYPAMGGVNIGGGEVAATDYFCLFASKTSTDIKALIPFSVIKKTSGIFSTPNIMANDSTCMLSENGITMYVKMIDANYPNYKQIIPTYETSCIVSVDELSGIIKYALSSASATTKHISLFFEGDKIHAESVDVDYARDCKTEPIAVVNKTFEDCKIMLRGDFTLKILQLINTETVQIFTSGDGTKVIILKPTDNENLFLQMPFFISTKN